MQSITIFTLDDNTRYHAYIRLDDSMCVNGYCPRHRFTQPVIPAILEWKITRALKDVSVVWEMIEL